MQDIGERCRKFICRNDFPGDIKLDKTALFAPVKFNDFPIGFIDSVSDDIVSICLWTNNMGFEKSADGDILAFDLYVTD